jgi:hypothetical protein
MGKGGWVGGFVGWTVVFIRCPPTLVPIPHIGSSTRSRERLYTVIAWHAIAGSIFAGWAVDAGTQRSAR